MAYVSGTPLDMKQLHFDKTPSASRSGAGQARPYVKVSRSAGGEQVAFQLGKRLRDSTRCPFGLEKTHADAAENEPYKVLKLELNESARHAIASLEGATVEAAVASSEAWFPSKKKLSQSTVEENFQTKIYSSTSSDGSFPCLLKLKVAVSGERQTKVLVTHEKAGGGYSKPVAGSWSDLTRGCKVLPCIKVSGGVYIVNRSYGTSLVATELCVVKEKKSAPVELDLGSDVDDGSECDPEADE